MNSLLSGSHTVLVFAASLPAGRRRGPISSSASAEVLLFDISSSVGASMDPVYAGWGNLVYNDVSGGFPFVMPVGAFDLVSGGVFNSGEFTLPDIPHGFNVPVAPPPSIVVPTSVTHVYWPLAPCAQQTTDYWMKSCIVQRKTLYKCAWPTCIDTQLMTKTKARTHVHKHLGLKKLYECSCGVQFACLDSAKRHANTQDKTYPCQFCLKHFARKDHRGAHQRKCGSLVSI